MLGVRWLRTGSHGGHRDTKVLVDLARGIGVDWEFAPAKGL